MVFDNDASRAKQFFQELIFKHYQAVEESMTTGPKTSSQLVQLAFTQQNVFDEFVQAVEGVPRDAINILSQAAQKALTSSISMNDIRAAAKNWYQRDKGAAVESNAQASHLLHWIIDEVIGQRRARAFLLRSNVRNSLIDELFDARVLHVLKRNISALDQPGIRYDAYKIDYGCYVDLINTTKATKGLLPSTSRRESESAFVDVPPDDYRSIRRAILDLDRFESTLINQRLF